MWTLPNGKQANNILHQKYGTPINTQAGVNSLFTSISTAFTSSGYAGLCSPPFKLFAVGYREPSDAGDRHPPREIVSNLGATSATGTGDPLPINVSFVVTLKTGRSGQANRGRVYLTGFTEGQNDTNGNAIAAVGTDCVSFITSVSGALSSSGSTHVIAHP